MPTIPRMGKKKTPAADRHKPRKMLALREYLEAPLEEYRRIVGATDRTDAANRAIIDALKLHNLWPPSQPPK